MPPARPSGVTEVKPLGNEEQTSPGGGEPAVVGVASRPSTDDKEREATGGKGSKGKSEGHKSDGGEARKEGTAITEEEPVIRLRLEHSGSGGQWES